MTSSCVFRCRLLRHVTLFVDRTVAADGGGINERLTLDANVIHTITVDEPTYAVTDPYTLELIN